MEGGMCVTVQFHELSSIALAVGGLDELSGAREDAGIRHMVRQEVALAYDVKDSLLDIFVRRHARIPPEPLRDSGRQQVPK